MNTRQYCVNFLNDLALVRRMGGNNRQTFNVCNFAGRELMLVVGKRLIIHFLSHSL